MNLLSESEHAKAIRFADLVLERIKLGAQSHISPQMVENADLFVGNAEDVGDGFLLRLRTTVLCQKHTQVFTIERGEMAATWWDGFKQRFAPRWILRRWPIRTVPTTSELHVNETRMYPNLRLPSDLDSGDFRSIELRMAQTTDPGVPILKRKESSDVDNR